MSSHHPHDPYFESVNSANRSPGSLRHSAQPQSLHRAPSRQFDPFGHMNGLYAPDENAMRYDTNRFDRPPATIHAGNYGQFEMPGASTWNPNAFGGAPPNLSMFAATGRLRPPSRRTPLPSTWLDPSPTLPTDGPLSRLGGPPMPPPMRQEHMPSDPDEELIPTAIVIKNIPFAVKKEQLVQLMTDLNLPLPYAFNYHFDNGVFRGLAFANFTTAEETAAVIDVLNHFELHGRKLRVEYKKMLPLVERERIEREKRERRGQLEEQHRPMGGSQLHNQASMSSMSSHIPATSPSPVSTRGAKPDVDLNDVQTLQFYSQLLLFKDDHSREALIFPSNLTPVQRRLVHTLAHHMSLAHVSRGNGEQRQVHVFRAPHAGSGMSPPIPQMPSSGNDSVRRGLNKAATTDFSEARGSDPGYYGTLGRQSSGLLDIPGSPGGNSFGAAGQNLRAAKSFADLRSYTPSPVPSSASFPASLSANISKYADYGGQGNMASSSSLNPNNISAADSHLANGFSHMSLGAGLGLSTGSSRDLRSTLSSEREPQQSFGGPIGSNRGGFGGNNNSNPNMGYDEQSRDRGSHAAPPMRQPRGPVPERGTGFSTRGRQNGHHQRRSDELDPRGNEIAV
ncbi:MAG: hypothetical protein M4579_000088 [Chaenotheca gracillima]|nr:MAG: hypothetical protein M4579_000088 [Chaenotheca gracillima]